MNFADNNILLILISLVFIYAVLSILVSIIVEWLNYIAKHRGKFLRDSIYNLIGDKGDAKMGEKFYNHIMINGLQSLRNRLPSYISSGMFSEVLVDLIAQESEKESPAATGMDENQKPVKQMMVRFKEGVAAMQPGEFKDLLQSFIDKSGQDYNQLKTQLENWYNDYMERVSGGYKLNQRKKFLLVGFVVAIMLNVDSIHLLRVLSLDDNLKNQLVMQAEKTADAYKDTTKTASDRLFVVNNTDNQLAAVMAAQKTKTKAASGTSTDSLTYSQLNDLIQANHSLAESRFAKEDSTNKVTVQKLDSVLNLLSQLNVPIGWSTKSAPVSWFCRDSVAKTSITRQSPGIVRYIEERNSIGDGWAWTKYLIGIVISGISLSFGAPFWFDMLMKLVNVRRAGKAPKVEKK